MEKVQPYNQWWCKICVAWVKSILQFTRFCQKICIVVIWLFLVENIEMFLAIFIIIKFVVKSSNLFGKCISNFQYSQVFLGKFFLSWNLDCVNKICFFPCHCRQVNEFYLTDVLDCNGGVKYFSCWKEIISLPTVWKGNVS